MISALETAFSLIILNILRPKVTQNVTKLLKKFCEFPPCGCQVSKVMNEKIFSEAKNITTDKCK